MTNFQSVAGGAIWIAVAAVLMLATFEPVSVERDADAASLQMAVAKAGPGRSAI